MTDVDASRPSEPLATSERGADFERRALEAFAVSLSQHRRNARTRSPSWCSALPGSLSVNIDHAPIILGNCGCSQRLLICSMCLGYRARASSPPWYGGSPCSRRAAALLGSPRRPTGRRVARRASSGTSGSRLALVGVHRSLVFKAHRTNHRGERGSHQERTQLVHQCEPLDARSTASPAHSR